MNWENYETAGGLYWLILPNSRPACFNLHNCFGCEFVLLKLALSGLGWLQLAVDAAQLTVIEENIPNEIFIDLKIL